MGFLGILATIPSTRWLRCVRAFTCRVKSSVENVHLSREQSTAIFRIFQEALTNVLRHAQATRVEVTIKETAGEFVLTISDNGRGLTARELSGSESLGLLGMRERAHLIGGKLPLKALKAWELLLPCECLSTIRQRFEARDAVEYSDRNSRQWN